MSKRFNKDHANSNERDPAYRLMSLSEKEGSGGKRRNRF